MLNNTHLKNTQVKEKNLKRNSKYFELDENKNTNYPNLWDEKERKRNQTRMKFLAKSQPRLDFRGSCESVNYTAEFVLPPAMGNWDG